MIDRNLVVEYLEPTLWGRLGHVLRILEPVREVAHVLIEEEGYRAFFRGRLYNREGADIPEGAVGQQMEAQFPEADEIRIYTRDTIAGFFTAVQGREIYDMDIDTYLQFMYETLDARIQILPLRKRRGNLWGLLETFGRQDGVYNIGVMQGEALYFQCMLELRAGKLVRVTTADRYGQDVFDWEKICENVRKEFSTEAVSIMITLEQLQEKYAV